MLPIARVIGHKEWAPGRKSDPVYDMNWRRAGVAGIQPRPAPPPPPPPPPPRPREDDCVYIKCKPYPDRPDIWTAILSGPIFIGLGSPNEFESADDAIAKGAPVQWVEVFTWNALDAASHRLCDNPRPVLVQNPAPPAPPPAS